MSKLFVALVLIAFSSSALAACFDAIQFSYSDQVQLRDIYSDISPFPDAVKVLFRTKSFTFVESNNTDYFYVVAHDDYYSSLSTGLVKVAGAGDIYYQTNFGAGSSTGAWFSEWNSDEVVYNCKENNNQIVLTVKALLNHTVYTNESKELFGDFISFTATENVFSVGSVYSNELLIPTTSIGREIAPGALLMSKPDGYYFVASPYKDRFKYYYVNVFFEDTSDFVCKASGDEFVKSSCVIGSVETVDYCDGDFVVDYSCSAGNSCVGSRVKCELGCVDGACVVPKELVCNDSDGVNEFVLGTVKGNDANGELFDLQDACVDGKLREYVCSINGEASFKEFDCDCVNGVCVEETVTSKPEEEVVPEDFNVMLVAAILLLIVLGAYYLLFAKPPKPLVKSSSSASPRPKTFKKLKN